VEARLEEGCAAAWFGCSRPIASSYCKEKHPGQLVPRSRVLIERGDSARALSFLNLANSNEAEMLARRGNGVGGR